MIQFGSIASISFFKNNGTLITKQNEIPQKAFEYLKQTNIDGLEILEPNGEKDSASVYTSPLITDGPGVFVYLSNNHLIRRMGFNDQNHPLIQKMFKEERTGEISVYLNEDGDSVERAEYVVQDQSTIKSIDLAGEE